MSDAANSRPTEMPRPGMRDGASKENTPADVFGQGGGAEIVTRRAPAGQDPKKVTCVTSGAVVASTGRTPRRCPAHRVRPPTCPAGRACSVPGAEPPLEPSEPAARISMACSLAGNPIERPAVRQRSAGSAGAWVTTLRSSTGLLRPAKSEVKRPCRYAGTHRFFPRPTTSDGRLRRPAAHHRPAHPGTRPELPARGEQSRTPAAPPAAPRPPAVRILLSQPAALYG